MYINLNEINNENALQKSSIDKTQGELSNIKECLELSGFKANHKDE